jgi:hypothetical protein
MAKDFPAWVPKDDAYKTIPKPKAQGVDIEILDRSDAGSHDVLAPTALRINGQEVLIPRDATVMVGDVRSDELVTVTLTVFASSLSIRHEPTS